MPINSRTKGAGAERKVCQMLNDIYSRITKEYIYAPFQRNQMQSAVGGADIQNPFNLSIEVKNQETNNCDAWWAQCVGNTLAGEISVLIYKRNRQKWRIRMHGTVQGMDAVVEIDEFTFQKWAERHMRKMIEQGGVPNER